MFRQKRSLGKCISQSNRVNKLSDRGALLYTWMIPHYDDEGRMKGDPEDVQFNVVPRRGFSTDEVGQLLLEMDMLGLVDWYVVENNLYLQMAPDAWEDHQTFKGIKRNVSKYPAYNPSLHEKNTLKGGQVHPKGWTGTPQRVDRYTLKGGQVHPPRPTREVKLREDKNSFSSNEEKQAEPAQLKSESKHFSNHISEEYLKPILKVCKELKSKSNGTGKFKVYRWLQMNNRGHPGAILKVLNSLLKNWNTVNNPDGYLNAIMKAEGQNYNEADCIVASEKIKEEWRQLEKSDMAPDIKNLLSHAFSFEDDI